VGDNIEKLYKKAYVLSCALCCSQRRAVALQPALLFLGLISFVVKQILLCYACVIAENRRVKIRLKILVHNSLYPNIHGERLCVPQPEQQNAVCYLGAYAFKLQKPFKGLVVA